MDGRTVHTNAEECSRPGTTSSTAGVGFLRRRSLAATDGILYDDTVVDGRVLGIRLASGVEGSSYCVANDLVQGAGPTTALGVSRGIGCSATNLSQDATSPQVALRSKLVTFVGAPNYHLNAADVNAKDQGTDLSADPNLVVFDDIDGQLRAAPWDIGADDADGTTAVKLMSLEAVASDAAVEPGGGRDRSWTTWGSTCTAACPRAARGRGSRLRSSPGSARLRWAGRTPSATAAS